MKQKQNFLEAIKYLTLDEEFILSASLPEYPRPNITLPIEKLKSFNAQFKIVSEFASIICGIPVEKLTNLNLISFVLELRNEEE